MPTQQVFDYNIGQFVTQQTPDRNVNFASTIQPYKTQFHNEAREKFNNFYGTYGTTNIASYTPTVSKVLNYNTSATTAPVTTATTQNNIEAERDKLLNQAINLEKDKLAFDRGIGITSSVFQGLGSTINAGLGIWGAIESAKNAKKSRELMDKQIANYNEQIEASREARQQRRDELARLSKMRSNTKAQFNTQASVTRSY